MKVYAMMCERCKALGEVAHVSGGGGMFAQMQGATPCSNTLPAKWATFEGKPFCGDCSSVIRAALDRAMRRAGAR